MLKLKTKNDQRRHRHRKIRTKISGTEARPRLAVFRSNRHIYAQLINDQVGKTLLAASDTDIKGLKRDGEAAKLLPKQGDAFLVGQLLATKALGLRVKDISFDRGGYLFSGRIKALALGARAGGLNF